MSEVSVDLVSGPKCKACKVEMKADRGDWTCRQETCARRGQVVKTVDVGIYPIEWGKKGGG